ncbi:MAG: gfo/Idh/MocA family oxidoreductase, partial [Kordiimonadaceae bacterium]|nr:gfo/Idh/MocA family oxidoreductase [Kordiimonadaceae bacterium]
MTSKQSRRSFIKKTAATAFAFSIVPRHVLGQGMTAPSDQLNIAVIGGGGKGYSDAVHAWGDGAANIAAICDVDWNMASNAFKKFPNAKKYKDYRKLLDEMSDIDAITVS